MTENIRKLSKNNDNYINEEWNMIFQLYVTHKERRTKNKKINIPESKMPILAWQHHHMYDQNPHIENQGKKNPQQTICEYPFFLFNLRLIHKICFVPRFSHIYIYIYTQFGQQNTQNGGNGSIFGVLMLSVFWCTLFYMILSHGLKCDLCPWTGLLYTHTHWITWGCGYYNLL